MASYELSQAAERDFESIFEYGIETFGLDQALRLIATVLSLRVSWASRTSPMLFLELRAVRDGWQTKRNGSHRHIAHRLVGRLFPLEPPQITRHVTRVEA